MCLVAALFLAGCTTGHPVTSGTSTTAAGQTAGSAATADAPSVSPSVSASAAAPGSSSSPSNAVPQQELGASTIGQLPAALSRLVAVPAGARVLLLGGLDAADHTTSAVSAFDPGSGRISAAGKLAVAAHDAAGGVLGGKALLVGGGSATSVDAAQQLPLDATTTTVATVKGHLPRARSDDSVAIGGNTMYVVGGYDGASELPDILATNDGVTFHAVAQLAQTVRYTAVAVVGNTLWVFGGEHHGTSIDAIQRVDLATHQVTVAAHLPKPLAHEGIVELGGKLLLVGGVSRGTVQNAIYQVDPSTGSVSQIGSLPVPTSDMGLAALGGSAYVFGGEALTAERTVAKTTAIERIAFQPVRPAASAQASGASFRGPAFDGKLLIADRGNNRLVLVDAGGGIRWTFPNAQQPPPPSGFYFPDDAFFTDHGKAIISNQEGNNTIVEISYPGGKSLWSYGHPGTPGAASGYLNDPDDAYRLADGRVIVADANNCRVVIISAQAQQAGQIGRTGNCSHGPHTLGYPNGDTPLSNGDVLVSEVHGSWISEYTLSGNLVWTTHVPLTYPSDPQQIGPDKYIVADYAKPGGIVEFDRAGHILWQYRVTSGHGMLDHPSLAEVLPSGVICVNDDYRHRVVMIDPATKAIVWQYGVDDISGVAPGLLDTPDGFDLLAPDGTTPTHPWTG